MFACVMLRLSLSVMLTYIMFFIRYLEVSFSRIYTFTRYSPGWVSLVFSCTCQIGLKNVGDGPVVAEVMLDHTIELTGTGVW